MAQGGGTPFNEALLEQKRQAIRQALKHEYIHKRFSPKAMDQGGVVFDAAVQRWHALQFTYGDHFVPTLRNFGRMCVYLSPIVFIYYAMEGPHHKEYKKAVARGEVPYDAPARKKLWAYY
eukprot:TRINITY_DN52854_c0_g1_i1.p1 TRINITY_DN52854_c0_g1~~TRINITY_DN52854_c0_g1_i1.p1  ORF type:complete len:120 (-),score=23.72 TRINITY_DN52854_c0_g1_i1:393-752(-)